MFFLLGDGCNRGSVVLSLHVGGDLFAGQRLCWLSEDGSTKMSCVAYLEHAAMFIVPGSKSLVLGPMFQFPASNSYPPRSSHRRFSTQALSTLITGKHVRAALVFKS